MCDDHRFRERKRSEYREIDTELRLSLMEGNYDVGGRNNAKVRDDHTTFGFGIENLREQWSFGVDQGINIPAYYPQTGAHFSSGFPTRSDFLGEEQTGISKTFQGFSYENNISVNTIPTSNMKRLAGIDSNVYPSQTASLHHSVSSNFYSPSALPFNSAMLATTSQQPVLENQTNQKSYICNMSCESIEARESNTLGLPRISRQLMNYPSMEEFDDYLKDTELKLIILKVLSNSDVGTVGRIVLPKKEAEAKLPPLNEREGMMLNMEDLILPVTWKFKYRFWPNNKSRMYIMENTGEFVKAHGLQAGDYFIIYKKLASESYVVRGKRGARTAAQSCLFNNPVGFHNDFSYQQGIVPDNSFGGLLL